MDDLENRVMQFNTLSLPGQPMSMHMGTSALVNDLWREVQKLSANRTELEELQRLAQEFYTTLRAVKSESAKDVSWIAHLNASEALRKAVQKEKA